MVLRRVATHVASACCYSKLPPHAVQNCIPRMSSNARTPRCTHARKLCLLPAPHAVSRDAASHVGVMAVPCAAYHFACCLMARCAQPNMHQHTLCRVSHDECLGENLDENLCGKWCGKLNEKKHTWNPVRFCPPCFSRRFSPRLSPRRVLRLGPRVPIKVFTKVSTEVPLRFSRRPRASSTTTATNMRTEHRVVHYLLRQRSVRLE
jgi:hypothetical protein